MSVILLIRGVSYTSRRVLVIEFILDLMLSNKLCSLGVLRGGGGLALGNG